MKQVVNKNGVALLMVLWVLMLLTVIVGEFCYTMRTRVNITRNFKESTKAYYIAVAGVNKAIYEIIRQEVMPRKILSVDDGFGEAAAPAWRMNTDIPPEVFGSGAYAVRIENESGKVNINLADQKLLKAMLSGVDMEDSEKDVIVDSILDWRDSDRNHRLNGAEDDYYQSLPEPYECKDDDFDSVAELLLVRGVTPEMYYQQFAYCATVFPKSNKKGSSKSIRDKNKKNEFDYNQLNINSLSPEMWAALPGMTDELVADIGEYRAVQDFTSVRELQAVVGPEVFRGIAGFLTTRTTPYYTIKSTGTIAGSRISAGVTSVIRIDNQIKEKYRIIDWVDTIAPTNRRRQTPIS